MLRASEARHSSQSHTNANSLTKLTNTVPSIFDFSPTYSSDGGKVSCARFFLVTCLIPSTENIRAATCAFFPFTSQTRGPNADAQKSGSYPTSFFPSPRAHPGVERG